VLNGEITCDEFMVLQDKLEFSSDEAPDWNSFAVNDEEVANDGYGAFGMTGDIFARFEELNNSNLRATLEEYDASHDAGVDRRTLSIWFHLPDCEYKLNKKEHEWYKLLLDTGASVSLISEGLFNLLRA